MSPAGTSVSAPMCLLSSVMNATQNLRISLSDLGSSAKDQHGQRHMVDPASNPVSLQSPMAPEFSEILLLIGLTHFPLGSKSAPPLPPPIETVFHCSQSPNFFLTGWTVVYIRPVRAFLKICSKPRNFRMLRLTLGWNRRPPLYGPKALLNCTR